MPENQLSVWVENFEQELLVEGYALEETNTWMDGFYIFCGAQKLRYRPLQKTQNPRLSSRVSFAEEEGLLHNPLTAFCKCQILKRKNPLE